MPDKETESLLVVCALHMTGEHQRYSGPVWMCGVSRPVASHTLYSSSLDTDDGSSFPSYDCVSASEAYVSLSPQMTLLPLLSICCTRNRACNISKHMDLYQTGKPTDCFPSIHIFMSLCNQSCTRGVRVMANL
eukprot:TRINITY_DN14312_c0_g3_i1.p1 TRINITY_DN14312_c0_g3~~TRINITY_DN14312_c0_g3_i1.p1  ORF type:complete len:133 (-),score=6.51 TRINITY_DN14312_c0_g3_i1:269-667(-)